MLIFILAVQVLTLVTLLLLIWLIVKITNRIGFLNIEQLAGIAASGVRLEAGAAQVAQDLSDAHHRADAVERGR